MAPSKKMENLRIYLDTSVINFLHAEDSPDFRRATLAFFEDHSPLHELFISDIVLLEISQDPNHHHRALLLKSLADYPVHRLDAAKDQEIRGLAESYMKFGVFPAPKLNDALHVAYATLFEMDVLLSWNFKHLANLNKETIISEVNRESGFDHTLRMCSPLELLDEPS